MIKLYTDGACRNHIKKDGAWAYVCIMEDKTETDGSGYAEDTTNNRMELQAAIEGIKSLNGTMDKIIVYSDSKYLVDGMNLWLKNWRNRDWKKRDNTEIPNLDLWQTLNCLNADFFISWSWVRSHNGNYYNEIVDKMAVNCIENYALI